MTKRAAWYGGVPIESTLDECERRQLRIFEILCRHFAYLERVVIGEVSFEQPTYFSSDSSVLAGPWDVQGSKLAQMERDRLSLGQDPVVGLSDMLDGMGMKIITRPLPESSNIAGGFLFRSDIGPCIMLNSVMSPPEQTLAMAHQYCHFLADFDPYLPRVCPKERPRGEDSCEDRAGSFALAFLLPEASLVNLAGGKGDDGMDPSVLDALAIYFGVPQAAVAERLDWLGVESVVPEAKSPEVKKKVSGEVAADLPERLVRLAVEARGRDLISDLRVARLLQVELRVARQLVAFFAAGGAPTEERGADIS